MAMLCSQVGVVVQESRIDDISNGGDLKMGMDGMVRNKPESVKDIGEYFELAPLDGS